MTDGKPTSRHKVFCALSFVVAVRYCLVYHEHRIGISPFHIGTRLPTVDLIELILFVVIPLGLGIVFGLLAGKLKWYALAAYPVVILVSLI